MNQITLQTMRPTVIKKLQNLARSHQRTLEEEITVILENAVLVDWGVDLIMEDGQESQIFSSCSDAPEKSLTSVLRSLESLYGICADDQIVLDDLDLMLRGTI